MFVHQLKLQDFCGHRDTEFNFNSKVVAITGKNGKGKSKILTAMNYCLTDYLEENIEEYVSWHGDAKEFNISQYFEHHDTFYRYEITGKKNGSEKRLWIDASDKPLLGTKATAAMKKVVNPKLALYSNIAVQQNSVGILFESPQPRLQKLKQLLSIHIIDDIVKRIDSDIEALDKKIRTIQYDIHRLRNTNYTFLEEIVVPTLNLEETKKQIDLLLAKKGELELLQKKFDAYNSNITAAGRTQQAIDELRAKLPKLNEEKDAIRIPSLADFDEAAFNKLQLEKALLEKERTAHAHALQKYNDTEKSAKDFEARIVKLQEEIDGIKLRRIAPLTITPESQKTLLQEIADLRSSITSLTKDKSLIESGKCENCGQDFHGDIAACTTKIAESQSKLAELQKLHTDNEMAVQAYNDEVSALQAQTQKKTTFQASQDQLKASLAAIERTPCPIFPEDKEHAYQDVVTQISTFDARKADFEDSKKKVEEAKKKLADKLNEIATTTATIGQLEAQLKLLDLTPVEKPEAFDQVAFNDLNNAFVLYEDRIKERDRIIQHNARVKVEKENNEHDAILKEQTINELNYTLNTLKTTKQVIGKEFASFLIEEGASYIKEQLNFFFQKVYNKYFIDFRKDKDSVDFLYSPDQVKYKPVRLASGFERVLLAMAFRVALMHMTGLGLLSLDEIDADADDDNSIELYQNLLAVPFNQMFCITHRKSTIEFLENDHGAQIITL